MITEDMISDIVTVLRRTTDGRCSIALAGSCATGMSDKDSDLDLYMLVDSQKSCDEIRSIISSVADADHSISISPCDSFIFGGGIDFYYRGVPIEVTVKSFAKIKQRADECLEGKFEIIPQTWTSNGYYTYISLSELNFIKPIFETDGFIQSYKVKLTRYPEKLRDSIISLFWGRANTWMHNFHYESAIKRCDYLFTAPIVLHTVLDMIQVIFALNETYFTGDKRLVADLNALPYCPAKLKDNLLFLLKASDNEQHLRWQYDILLEIRDELEIKIEEIK